MRADHPRIATTPLRALLVLLAVSLLRSGNVWAVSASSYYVQPSQVALAEVLPPPPRPGSIRGKADLQAVVDAEHYRDKDVESAALADLEESVFRSANVMGEGFNSKNLPFATAFFARLASDGGKVLVSAKMHFNRPRPFTADSEITTLVPKPPGPSYPSGHATFAYLNAIVLSDMVPEKTDAIFSRASDYSYHRVIEGVHYPSDIEAGMISASVIANVLLHQPGFLADFARARAEVRTAVGLKQ